MFYEKVFIEISQNLQENTCARDSLLKIDEYDNGKMNSHWKRGKY